MMRWKMSLLVLAALGAATACQDADPDNEAPVEQVASELSAPPTPAFGPAIDAYSGYEPQTTCDPSDKPGVSGFRDLLDRAYGRHDSGISRGCNSEAGTSEHKEGRALDYMLDVGDAQEDAIANHIIDWLLATDQYGNPNANARRLGVMYIIRNRRIWGAYRASEGWRPYTGDNPHTDHIHFSFSWAGARQQTSWWSAAAPAAGASVSGDARAEIVSVDANGDVRAFPNLNGFVSSTYGSPVTVGWGWGDPARVRFADLDGDGRNEIISIDPNGEVRAFRNHAGLESGTYSDSIVVGWGWGDPARVRFADLDGDGRAEIISIDANGEVRAFPNTQGLTSTTFGAPVTVGWGWGDAARVRFADLDGDGRAEIISIDATGEIRAFRNHDGLISGTYSDSIIVGWGWGDPARVRFADIDGDGRDEIISVDANGEVRAFHNNGGYSTATYGEGLVIGSGWTDANRCLFG